MRRAQKLTIEDARAALQPFYEAGDDGYPVSLALDALAGLLAEKVDLDVKVENALLALLEELKAPVAIRTGVEKLYKNAAGGEYGVGLSRKQARTINELVEDVVDELVDYIESLLPRRRTRSGARASRVHKRRKR